MVLDSSALVAVLMQEPGWEELLVRMKDAAAIGLGAPSLAEVLIVLVRRLGGDPGPLLADVLRELMVEVIPFTEEHSQAALGAYLRFGKGRHPAALNFGDCLSYATAAISGEPLLYIGADFSQTDIARA